MSGDEFEVEKILGKRTRNGRTKYKIRWKGFDETEDSWEPEANLTHCDEMIQQFNRDHDRDVTLINRTLTDYPPMLNGSTIRSPLWSSTPAPFKRDETLSKRLHWDDTVTIFEKTPDLFSNSRFLRKEKPKKKTTVTANAYEERPASRWPLLVVLLLLLGLALYTLWEQI